MRIIDILVNIANGKKVPKKIKYHSDYFVYDEFNQKYRNTKNSPKEDLLKYIDFYKGIVLNDLVEIIEDTPKEVKIPEKLGLINYCEDQATLLIHHKVDEIIDYLKSKGE